MHQQTLEPLVDSLTRSRAAEVRACSCGQDLDSCHTHHCPRCGVTLR